jgi:hypothetical protein
MKAKLVIASALSFSFALPAIHASKARAEKPPVDVQALDEDEEDFFNDKPAAKKKAEEPKEEEAPPKKVKKQRSGSDEEDMFDELDATEKGVKIKKKKGHSDNENTNQQVVNVVVVGEKDTKSIAGTKASSENDAKNDAKQLQKQVDEVPVAPFIQTPPGQKARTTRETVPQSASVSHPVTTSIPQPSHTWNDWWNRENKLEAGDVMFFLQVGAYGGQANEGLGLEALFSDWTGIRLTVNGSFFDAGHGFDIESRPDGGSSGGSGIGGIGPGNVGSGGQTIDARGYGFFNGGSHISATGTLHSAFTHLEDLALTFHFGHSTHGFDLEPSIGLAHFGYDFKTDGGEEKGGAGFMKLAIGANWFYKRFFLGAEAGWYPLEIFKYGVQQQQFAARNDVVWEEIGQPWDWHRFRFTGHVGMNF